VAESIDEIRARALQEIADAGGEEDLEAISVKYLGRKGAVTRFLRNISELPAGDRFQKISGYHQYCI